MRKQEKAGMSGEEEYLKARETITGESIGSSSLLLWRMLGFTPRGGHTDRVYGKREYPRRDEPS